MRGAKDAPLLRSVRGYAQHMCAALLLSLVGLAHAQSSAPCSPTLGRVVSLQGSIEMLRSGSASWQRLTRLDTPVCRGDQLRAGLLSRAAMYISPETLVRLDQNTTLELVDQTEAETVLRFHQDDFTRRLAAQSTFCGVGYFITRFPRKLRVRTPFYNAVVEGTEFQVAMTCDRGELAVFEGKVAAESVTASDERVLLESGQSTSVGIGETPTAIKTIVKPSDAVQWALYYLPLTDVSLLSDAALQQNCAQLSVELRSGCLIRRAEYLLRVGRAQEARAELAGLLLAEPSNGDVLALQSIIAVVQNDKRAALDFAQRAIDAAPNSFRPYAALSYALQANFKLEEALNSAKRASALAPDSALLRARNAELQLSLGRVRSAEREAIEAVRLNPNESRAHLILGFVHLAQIDTKKATTDFNTAIELDSTEPLARLGLGLATIREGRLQQGREQIEIAVALDPTNSLVRSYVGKAYYEENSKARDQLAATQFGLAKALDPNDPTPWFYDAILKQTQNRPVEALEDLQKSIELNDNRAVYRSALALDEDRATRAASIGRIYLQTGSPELARLDAYESLSADPANYSAHRLLADSYSTEPTHEISRQSELLQAQVRQPPSLYPALMQVAPELSLAGPFRSGTPAGGLEYSPLFEQARTHAELYGLLGSQQTAGAQVIGSILGPRISGALSFLTYDTDGSRPNNQDSRRVGGALLTLEPLHDTFVQIGLSSFERDTGDLPSRIDEFFSQTALKEYERDDGWVALRHKFSAGFEGVVTLGFQHRTDVERDTDPLSVAFLGTDEQLRVKTESVLAQAQGIWRAERGSVTLGMSRFSGDSRETNPFESVNLNPRHFNAYAYGNLILTPSLLATVGLSYDDFRPDDFSSRSELNPKLGVTWKPFDETSVRFASYKTLKRRINADQALEPTQIAGFNQFVDDINGAIARGLGGAIDQAMGKIRVGMTVEKRTVEVPVLVGQPYADQEEHKSAAYFVWLPTRHLVFRAALSRENYVQDDGVALGSHSPKELLTWQVPLSVQVYFDRGFSGYVSAQYVNQNADLFDELGEKYESSSSFWVVNMGISQHLPRRQGRVGLEVRNLLGESFKYQDLSYLGNDPTPRMLAPVREIMLTVELYL